MTTEDFIPPPPRLPTPSPDSKAVRALEKTLGGLPGTLVALAMAVGGVITAWQNAREGRDTTRAAYDTLKVNLERQSAQLEQLRQSDLELRAWVQELSDRQERRQVAAEKVIRKAVTSPPKKAAAAAAPLPLPPEPLPPAPPAPAVTPQSPTLPPFEKLQ